MTKPRPSSLWAALTPPRCRAMTLSETGMKAWFGHSPHFTCGLPQIPFTHSLVQAGAYPDRFVRAFSHRIGNTSDRPAKRWRKRPIFWSEVDDAVTITDLVAA